MKKVIVLFLIATLLLGLCACGSLESITNDLPKPSNGITSGNGTTVTKKEFKPGETAELNNVSVTFIGVTESTGSQFNSPADGMIFVLCEFEIVNNSNEEINISSMMSFEAYYDDTACNLSLSALIEKGNKGQLDGTIAAGKKMVGVVGYEVPSSWTEMEIQFTPDVFSTDKLVFVAPNN